MTTIPKERKLLMQALDALETCAGAPCVDRAKKAVREYLAAPATAPDELERLRKDAEQMREALMFYAEGDHFTFDRDAWDTVSDEPQNYWCDEAGTATVEDGTIAKLALDAGPAARPGNRPHLEESLQLGAKARSRTPQPAGSRPAVRQRERPAAPQVALDQ